MDREKILLIFSVFLFFAILFLSLYLKSFKFSSPSLSEVYSNPVVYNNSLLKLEGQVFTEKMY